jgi:hypothetical protein
MLTTAIGLTVAIVRFFGTERQASIMIATLRRSGALQIEEDDVLSEAVRLAQEGDAVSIGIALSSSYLTVAGLLNVEVTLPGPPQPITILSVNVFVEQTFEIESRLVPQLDLRPDCTSSTRSTEPSASTASQGRKIQSSPELLRNSSCKPAIVDAVPSPKSPLAKSSSTRGSLVSPKKTSFDPRPSNRLRRV